VNRIAPGIGRGIAPHGIAWVIAAAALGALAVTGARAAEPVEAFPSRPVRIVVPFTPGGGTDLIARKLQPGMQERLGQPVVVENRPGGNARIGANTVAKAEPDGYTVLLTTSGAFVIVPFLGKVAYDPLRDFAPVTLIARSPVLLVAGPRIAARSVADLIALAKNAPGKLTYASSGVGGPPHLSFELLKQAAGFDMLMIPYSSTGEVDVALLRGDVEAAVGALSAVAPTLQTKDVKALGVTSAKRSAACPTCLRSPKPFPATRWRRGSPSRPPPARQPRSSTSCAPPSWERCAIRRSPRSWPATARKFRRARRKSSRRSCAPTMRGMEPW
jgi:tripartite-type tricarboxylate transporter receptor subunit TctC